VIDVYYSPLAGGCYVEANPRGERRAFRFDRGVEWSTVREIERSYPYRPRWFGHAFDMGQFRVVTDPKLGLSQ
jgi:hypothetical protein